MGFLLPSGDLIGQCHQLRSSAGVDDDDDDDDDEEEEEEDDLLRRTGNFVGVSHSLPSGILRVS